MNIVDRFNSGVDFEDLYQKDIALNYCVLTVLSKAQGHENRIPRPKLINRVKGLWWARIGSFADRSPGDRKIRNCIRELRKDGALIMSTGGYRGGYWKAVDYQEVKEFIDAELRSRALDQLHTSSRMLNSARQIFGGQAHLWLEMNYKYRQYQEAITILED